MYEGVTDGAVNIAVEAVVNGKVVLATPDTFPAFLAGEAGHLVDFAADAIDALAGIVRDWDRAKARAEARRDTYLETHSSARFAATLCAPNERIDTDIVPGMHRYQDRTAWRRLVS